VKRVADDRRGTSRERGRFQQAKETTMAAEDLATILHRIHELAQSSRTAPEEAMRTALAEIAALASTPAGDTPEQSDIPQTENQSL
jgi:hypothetical protein